MKYENNDERVECYVPFDTL